MNRNYLGIAINRSEFPEAAAVWDKESFSKGEEVFYLCGFLVVYGKILDVLQKFDLGGGSLLPFPIYHPDLETLCPENFYLLNFGSRKQTLLIDECENVKKFIVHKDTGQQSWRINPFVPDAKVVLSAAALNGADLWMEDSAYGMVFMSDALARAIIDIGMADVFRLHPCEVLKEPMR